MLRKQLKKLLQQLKILSATCATTTALFLNFICATVISSFGTIINLFVFRLRMDSFPVPDPKTSAMFLSRQNHFCSALSSLMEWTQHKSTGAFRNLAQVIIAVSIISSE